MDGSARDAVFAAIADSKNFDELGSAIVKACADAFDAEVCTIWRRSDEDQPRLRLLSATATAPQTLAQEITYRIHEDDLDGRNADGVTGYVAQTRKEVHVCSFRELRDRFDFCWRGAMDRPQWDDQPESNFRSLSAFPLTLGNKVVGVFKFENKRNSAAGFPEQDRQAIRELAPDIALAVHSFTLLESHEEKLIKVPADLVTSLLSPFDPKTLLKEIVKSVANSLRAEICSLWLVDPGGNELRLAEGYGFATEARSRQVYRLADPAVPDREIDGITAWVAIRRQAFWANSWAELKAHPSWKGKWDKEMWTDRKEDFRCLYAVPLMRQSEVRGVLKVENRIGGAAFTTSDRAMCGILASLIVLLDLGEQLRVSLISDIVHTIRSPIGQVPMNLSGLVREIRKFQDGMPVRRERIDEYVNLIKKALLAATVSSKTLILFTRRASLESAVRKEKIVVADLVTGRLNEVELLLYDGIKTHAVFDDDTLGAAVYMDVTDYTRAQTALDNILHNAIKYSRANGTITVALRRVGEGVSLSITDEGLGISPDDLPRIFDPGFSRRAPGHPDGTGVGLTTVRQILDRFDWKYAVKSQVGHGTSIEITIPTEGDAL